MNTVATISSSNNLASVEATGRRIHQGLTVALQLIMRQEAETSLPPQTAARGEEMTETEIDETLAASFPASDPPSWTLGIDRRASKGNDYEEQTQPNQERPLRANAPSGD